MLYNYRMQTAGERLTLLWFIDALFYLCASLCLLCAFSVLFYFTEKHREGTELHRDIFEIFKVLIPRIYEIFTTFVRLK